MPDVKQYTMVINKNAAGPLVEVQLPTGSACDFPLFYALLFVDSKIDPDNDMNRYRFAPSFKHNFLWQPLLKRHQLPAFIQFPPDVHASFANTLELQAARMLLNACKSLDLACHIRFQASTHVPLMVKVIDCQPTSSFKSTIATEFHAHCSISLDNVQQTTPSFDGEELFKHFDQDSRDLLALWQSDDDYFSTLDNLNQSMAARLWSYRNKSGTAEPQQAIFSIERHFINASVSLLDEVIVDKNFVSQQTSENNQLFANIIKAYAHIKCNVPFSIATLDKITQQTKQLELPYWQAFFLTYGHIIRGYSKKFIATDESEHFLAAQKIFKEVADLTSVTRVLHAHASLLCQERKFKHSIKLMNICLNIRTFLHETAGIARVLNGMAFVHLQSDKLDESIKCHRQAIEHLKSAQAFEELAFTYSLLSWVYFLKGEYKTAVMVGQKTLALMEKHQLHTLAFRTKPDIHAQLGICYFYHQDFELARTHSNYCEAHKVDSSATGELQRTLLRGLINDHRGDTHLADISFKYIPELIQENSEVDVHIQALFYRIMLDRLSKTSEPWTIEDAHQQGIDYCQKYGLHQTISWFDRS